MSKVGRSSFNVDNSNHTEVHPPLDGTDIDPTPRRRGIRCAADALFQSLISAELLVGRVRWPLAYSGIDEDEIDAASLVKLKLQLKVLAVDLLRYGMWRRVEEV